MRRRPGAGLGLNVSSGGEERRGEERVKLVIRGQPGIPVIRKSVGVGPGDNGRVPSF